MSKITLENNLPCTVIAVLGNEKDKESKEREVMLAPLDRFEDLPDGFEIDDATFAF